MATTRPDPQQPPPGESPSGGIRRVAIASYIGTTLEWYDYFAYGTAAALVFNQLFFPTFDPIVGTLAAFLSFAVGFIARPLGAVFFGHIGDRQGRKKALVITIVLMGLATGAIGVLPTYETIGVAAPILLTALRFLQGFSVGGEWSGAASLTIEYAPKSHRVRWAALVQQGSPTGTLLSSGLFALLTTVLPDNQFVAWGWRVPFIVAFAMLAVGLYMRLQIEESPMFRRAVQERRVVRLPLGTAIRTAWGRMLAALCAAQLVIGGFYLTTTFMISYGTGTLDLPESLLLNAIVAGAVVEMAVIFAFGWVADIYGAIRTCVFGGLLAMAMAFPVFALVTTQQTALVVLGVAVGIGVVSVPYAAIGPVLAQIFTDEVRYSAMAVSYNLSGVLGGFVPALATSLLIAAGGHFWGPAVLLVAIGAMTFGGSVAAGMLSRRARYM